MTTRTDVDVDYYDSPRVLEVEAPSVEMTMQDLIDTVRKQEDSFEGMSFKKLANASGKEDLGGGVLVGITVSQQDMRLAFEGRTTPAETGTVTSNPGSVVLGRDSFIDTTALFQTNNVARGSLVINFTDQSIAEVYRVDSETQLTTKTLVNGIGNTYDVNDVYQVFNVVQCSATGGNLVAVDAAQSTIPAILPTAFTQVVLTASASATTQNQSSLNFASYNNEIVVDQGNLTGLAQSGTAFPAGTGLQPVQDLADAKLISIATGLRILRFRGNYTFAGGDNIDGFVCTGDGPSESLLDLGLTTSTIRTQFSLCELTGDVNGAINVNDCHIDAITGVGSPNFETTFHRCLLQPGTVIALSATPNLRTIHIVDCESGSPGDVPVILDYNGSDADMTVRKYAGGMQFINNTSAGTQISYDGDSHLTLDATNTEGTWAVRGDTYITDNSTGNATVIDQGTYGKLLELWQRLGLDPSNPLTTNDDNSISVGGIVINAVNGATSTTQTRAP